VLDTLIHKYLHIPYRLNVHYDQKAKKSRATILLLHGMGNSGASWDEIVTLLPDDVRVISIDLLGFGQSPHPRWLKYSIKIQANAVIATLLRASIRQPLIIVGHSMGSLVAVEIAKRYPLLVKSLILGSPPFYSATEKKTLLPTQTALLKEFYKIVMQNPKSLVGVVPAAIRLKIVGHAFNVTTENVDIYMSVLESSILHQSSFTDVMKIRKPIRIISGRFDPIIVKQNLKAVTTQNNKAELTYVATGHELIDRYIPAMVKEITKAI